jgi:hypothetical protein
VAASALAALAVAAPAEAAKFCVQKPQCVQQGGIAVPTVGSAFASAAGNGGNRDRVELGKKEFDNGPFTAASGNPVNVVGSGVKETTLTRTSTTNNAVILTLDDEDAKVSDLKVKINDGSSVRGIDTPGTARDLRVVSQSASFGQIGVRLEEGGSLIDSRVALPTSSAGSAAVGFSGGSTARDSRLEASVGAAGGIPLGGAVRGIRLAIVAQSIGFTLSGGNGVLDQATIRLLTNTGGSAFQVSPSSGDAKLTARHVTAVGTGAANTSGASASATGVAGSCPTAKLVLRNSILRGFDVDLRRSALGIMCVGTPTADISASFSDFDPASTMESGAGAIDLGSGNRNVNPQFVKQGAGNYHLKSSSPVIDKGQPGQPKPGESKTDLDGRKRVLDGDGDGSARRDIGAFERPG